MASPDNHLSLLLGAATAEYQAVMWQNTGDNDVIIATATNEVSFAGICIRGGADGDVGSVVVGPGSVVPFISSGALDNTMGGAYLILAAAGRLARTTTAGVHYVARFIPQETEGATAGTLAAGNIGLCYLESGEFPTP